MMDDKHRLSDILRDPGKKVIIARGALSRLLRVILRDLDIGESGWNKRMVNYLDDASNGIASQGKTRSTARGNMNKQGASDPMTIKTFLKCMRFLGATKIRFTVELTFKRRSSKHSIDVVLKNHKEPDDIDVIEEMPSLTQQDKDRP